jgi:uncharacterized protein (TIGR02145 family)
LRYASERKNASFSGLFIDSIIVLKMQNKYLLIKNHEIKSKENMKKISRQIACFAIALIASISTILAQTVHTIAPDGIFVITDPMVNDGVPEACDPPVVYHWVRTRASDPRSARLVPGEVSATLTIHANTLIAGETYIYQRDTRCGDCGQVIYSPKILVSRLPSTDATLKDIEVNEGTLSPTFASATVAYTVHVAEGVSSITVTGIPNHRGASVAGNVTDLPLTECGDNTITLTVTAEDGATHKTYTVTVFGSVSDGAYTYRTKCYNGVVWMIDNAKKPLYITDDCQRNSIDRDNYGHLYSWNCSTANKACPAGWILPNDADFNNLKAALNAGGVSAWADWNSGFSLAGNGYDGNYNSDEGYYGEWWSSSSATKFWAVPNGLSQMTLNSNGGPVSMGVRCRKP